MKMDRKIEELLNSYIDGEGSDRQKVEVQRLIQHDEAIAQRLRELSKYRNLLGSMSRAKAPPRILENVKGRLEERVYREPVYGASRGRGAFARRLFAAAAMIALIGLLGFVIYTVVVPEGKVEQPFLAGDGSPSAPGGGIVEEPFYGRLILQTPAGRGPAGIEWSINRAVEQSGLSVFSLRPAEGNRKVYVLEGTRAAVARVMEELSKDWDRFDSSTLVIETDSFQEEVVVESITAEQVMRVLNQGKRDTRIMVAKDINLSNKVELLAPGVAGLPGYGDLESDTLDLTRAPKPVLTGKSDTKAEGASGAGRRGERAGAQVHLRIIIEPAE